jgi:pimeloyl-ACP methyl ester carboxylesterase
MFNDFGMWLWDLLATLSPKATVRQLISMESSLGPKQIEELLEEVMNDPNKVRYVMNLIKSVCPISLRKNGLNNDLKQYSSLQELPLHTITTPTLIIHGTADADVPIQHAEFAASKIPHAQFCRVENGFHILKLSTQADEILNTKLAFLNTHAPAIFLKHRDHKAIPRSQREVEEIA